MKYVKRASEISLAKKESHEVDREHPSETAKPPSNTAPSSEAYLRELVEVAPDGIFVADVSGRCMDVNGAGCRMLGYRRDELIGKAITDLMPPEDVPRLLPEKDAFLRGETRLGEWLLRRTDGAWLRVEVSSKMLPNGRWYAFVRDIGERRRIEEALPLCEAQRKPIEEERFLALTGKTLIAAGQDTSRQLTDIAHLIVHELADWCVVDVVQGERIRRLKVVHSDPALALACEALERLPIDLRWPHFLADVIYKQRPLLVRDVQPGLIEALAQNAEHRRLLRAFDPTSLIMVPLVARGQVLGTLGFGSSHGSRRYGPRDVHEAEEVASCVALAVDNANLHEDVKRAVRARDDVLGIVAHDLRNPLNTILVQSQMLRHPGTEPERRDQKPLERIVHAAMRMNRLIEDLLDVSRLGAGQGLSMSQTVVPVASLVAEVVEQQKARGLPCERIDVDLAGELPAIRADRARALQVFDNLLGNAIKFSPPDGRIAVGASLRDGEVLFWVTDSGPGLSEEGLSHLFDRFWQATQTDRRGAGLGLSIVKAIVDAHGGRIWVETKVGVGTTFYFTMPVVGRA